MPVELIETADGSNTLFDTHLHESWHSLNGALTESKHVFIEAGLLFMLNQQGIDHRAEFNLFEMGFGTGLNAILTLVQTADNDVTINYDSLELEPLPLSFMHELNYQDLLEPKAQPFLRAMYESPWDQPCSITNRFILHKMKGSLLSHTFTNKYHLVYFDAFAPAKQPELWTTEIFEKLFNSLVPGGALVTYSSKGEVKRTLRNVGFEVQRLAGPPGKRHMLRAVKPTSA